MESILRTNFVSHLIRKVRVQRALLSLLFVFMALGSQAQNAFITKWNASRDGARITIPTKADEGVLYNYTIDWGDGSAPETNQTGDVRHTYTNQGTYTVKITGDFPQMGGGGSLLLSVEQWGDIAWTSFEEAFNGARNMQINATDAPNLTGVTSMALMFQNCTALNSDISHWDVSGITDMSGMFNRASSFNQDLNGWDVSSVTNMSSMFNSASAFNGDISNWNVSNVTDMSSMFTSASAFNSDISQWNVSNLTTMFSMFRFASAFNVDISGWQTGNVTSLRWTFFSAFSFNQDISGWDVSKVTTMEATFSKANSFNQNISSWNVGAVTNMSQIFDENTIFNQDISAWDVSSVTDMGNMFDGATAFNQDLSSWNVSAVTEMGSMFLGATAFNQSLGDWDIRAVTGLNSTLSNSGLSVANYDATLVGWADQDITIANTLWATGLKYCTAGALAREVLIDKGWSFIGDEVNASCFPVVIDATKDSDTQITVEFSENVMTAGGNPTDFTVTDDANNNYVVSAQIDDVAGDAKVVLTVADMSAAVGDITVAYTNNNDEIVGVTNGPVDSTIRGFVIDLTPPVMVAGTRDSNTQLTIEFSDAVTTNEGNPGDFMVVDDANNVYAVIAQADDIANDTRIVLTVDDITMAIGSLTVTYTNNNDEISNFLGSVFATDATGIRILDESLPLMASAVKDSDTQITLSFNEPVQVNGTNASDFTITDGAGNLFAVTGIADGTAQDTDIVLTVANMSTAVGGLTITYANNNNEVRDFGNNSLATDAIGVFISVLANSTDFVMVWETTSSNEEITIPTTDANGEIYNYTIDWGDGSVETNQTGDVDHTYVTAGKYMVSISGDFSRIYFENSNTSNRRKILSVEQWGSIAWTSFNKAFSSCQNMHINATDAPDLSGVTDLTDMFSGCRVMNEDISHWDVSNITVLQGTFSGALAFNQDLSNWDVSNVTDMWETFNSAASFDQSLADWDITSVERMPSMLNNSGLSVSSYDATLVGWAEQNVLPNVSVGASGLTYCVAGEIAREALKARGWSFSADNFNFECSPIMLSAVKNSDTQITVTFNEGVQTNGSNPTDFTVTDGGNNTYTVSAQTASTGNSTDIVLTVANLASATGDITITYTNNNKELVDASTQTLFVDTDTRGVVIDFTPSVMVSGTRDSNTQLTIRFDDRVRVAGTNPGDFVVKDEANNNYTVSGITDGFAADKEITLTVADLSLSIGDLTVTYTNNNGEVKNLNDVAMVTDATGLVIPDTTAPVMVSATKDNNTQITLTFSEAIQTNGGNPIDFTVTDGGSNTYTVSAQADGTANDKQLVLTVANLSGATGGITITYTNNNAEVKDFANNALATDEAGVHISIFSNASAFVTTWRTDEAREKVEILTNDDNGENYNYTVDWGDGRVDTSETGNASHTYTNAGTYTVIITGDFPRIYLAARSEIPQRLMTVEQWGTGRWSSFQKAFQEAHNMQIVATDIPDLRDVTDMSEAFSGNWSLNYDFAGWDVNGVTNMSRMFNNCYSLESGLSTWDVSNVTDMSSMLNQTRVFNGDLSGWEVGNVTDMSSMFSGSAFNGNISGWDVSKVTNMRSMFHGSAFNGDISTWNVGLVENMFQMFAFADFAGDINQWNVGSVTDMSRMFWFNEAFNSDLNSWDVSAVTDMEEMFEEAISFNGDISSWDVGNVTASQEMFLNARAFNQDVSGWQLDKVTNVTRMFSRAGAFDQNLGDWDVTGFTIMTGMLDNTNLSTDNYDATLTGWSTQAVRRGLTFGAEGLMYCNVGQAARDLLTGGDNVWKIIGDSRASLCPPVFISAEKVSDTEITAIFSDPVQTNGGNPTDFTVVDGAGNSFTVTAQADGTAGDTEIDLTVASLATALGDLKVTYTNNNNEISDVSATFVAGTSSTITIDLDTTAPVMQTGSIDSDTQVTVVFSEAVQTNGTNPTDFVLTDGNGTNYPVSAQVDDTAFDSRVVLTVADISVAVGDLTLTYTNNNDEISDFGGNVLDTDGTGVAIVSDATPPTVAITSTANDPTGGAFDITVTFSEDVTGFDITDLTVGNGTAGNFAGSGAVYTATITPTTDGTVTVDLPANTVQDLAGNDNTASNTVTIENDETTPTVTVSSIVTDPTAGPFDITITFSEDVTGFDITDLTVGNGTAGSFAGTGDTYTATITPAADGTVTIDISTGAGQDAAGNDNTAATQFSIENDETDPTLTISTTTGDPTSGAFTATFTFDEAVTGFTIGAISVGNGIAGTFAGTGATYTATITPTTDGTVTVDVASAVAQDAAGNDNTAASQFSIENDETVPDVTLSTTAPDPNSGAFDIIATFTEDVMNIITGDFNVTNGTATAISGSGAVYTITITPTADGTVTVNLPANTVQDLANNDNTASNTITLENDQTAPTVTIATIASDPVAGAFDITITFSEDVTGFDLTDLTVGNGAASNFAGSGAVYTATITPAADGAVTADIAANAGQDAATNGNTAATQFSIENDETTPAITISTTDADPTSGAFIATFTFSEDVTGFAQADITVGNGAASNFAGSGTVYTTTVTPVADGTVTVDVAGAVAQDAAGNDNIAATQFSIENDETVPTVTITSLANDPINGAFDITLTFSEDVTGLDLTDLTVVNSTASNLTGSGSVYTVTITPATDGSVMVDLGAASVQDGAGNDNTAATQFSIQADLTAPAAPVITDVSDDTGSDNADQVTNDNTLVFTGTAEANSTVEVFIDGSSIGTTTADGSGNWTFDHSGTSLADADYNVTASATDAATNTSALSTTLAITVDTVAPSKAVLGSISDDTGISNTDLITNDTRLIYFGTAEPFSAIALKSGPFTLATATVDANGDWVGDVTFRPFTSPITIFITTTDVAGNVSVNSDNYLIGFDVDAPAVQSINRADANPTTSSSVDFTVTFSEEVHGLNTSSFTLALTSTQNASIASLSASSGTSITVTVDNITGEGSFGLNLSDITGITDVAGNDLSGTFTGQVYNTNFTPTDITLSASSILENNAIGDIVATLSTTDADAGDTHTYSLVTGTGDTDNASFTIAGDELKAAESFDLETKASYDIRLQTDDGRGGIFEKAVTITIDNVPEADLRITGNNDIPATPLGITTTFDITIHNDGDATLTVGSILYPTAFGGPVSGINIPPNSSQIVTMDFTPTAAQLYTGDITIITNGGTGILSVSADGAIITAIDDDLLKAAAIKLYPNPATDNVTIDLSRYSGRILNIQLYDMSGIKTFGINQYRESTLKLDVSQYHNGLYLVQFTDGKSTVQKKIMIRK